LPFSAIFKA